MSALPQDPAAPPNVDDAGAFALKRDIDQLLPSLYKADSTHELSSLLNIVARARVMGKEGHEQLVQLAKRLRRMRAFDDLYVLTSAMNADGVGDKEIRRYEIQALIELGVYETALDLVRPLIADGVTTRDGREAYGHLGRIYKQMYADAVKPPAPGEEANKEIVDRGLLELYLQRAFAAYMHVWHNVRTPETAWHGINAVAIASLAEREGFNAKNRNTQQLARDVLAVVSAPGVDDGWARGTTGQAHIALGDYASATEAYAAFVAHADVDPFAIAGTIRQLEEMWGINGAEPIRGQPLRLLKAALIAKLSEEGASSGEKASDAPLPLDIRMTRQEARMIRDEVVGHESTGVTGSASRALQKTFSENFPLGVKQLRIGMQRADAVCRIHGLRGGEMEAFASGFAIKGNLLCDAWGEQPVIVTNNHVIASQPTAESRRFDLCQAVFVSPEDDSEQIVKFERILWESDIGAHDITVLRIQGDLPASVKPLADLLPTSLGPRAQDDAGIGRCYVIGFPGARELSFSFADNILLDHDCPDGCEVEVDPRGRRHCKGAPANPVHIHYRTPTIGGSSGSPVFDGDHFALLGVHHSGAPDLKRLNGRPGVYAANEGIWIDSIREAIADSASAADTEGWNGGAARWRGFANDAEPRAEPANVTTADIVARSLPGAAAVLSSDARELPGSPGQPAPGISDVARQVIYKPGKAEESDVRAARLESIIGHDNRTRIFDTSMAPWRMICAIRARWGSRLMVGTGCMIGPNTVLTAGHVVFPREFGSLPDSVEVIPGLNADQLPYGAVPAAKISVHPRWNQAFEIQNDISVIHLAQPVGQQVGWFGVAARTREDLLDQWAHVTGYPGEKKEERDPRGLGDKPPAQAAQLWHHAAPIMRVEANRIFYKTDTTAGQSGAPIYVLREAGNYAVPLVVGVHAYGARTTPGAFGPANSGAWITDDMLKIIAMWKAI
jgi:V8-like Glu-specific endopeptidase